MIKMDVRLRIPVIIGEEELELDTLFDSGSKFSLASKSRINELFKNAELKPLPSPRKLLAANGTSLIADSLIIVFLKVLNKWISDVIYLSSDIKHEVLSNGELIKFPDLIIGVLCMEGWGIELDFEHGKIKSCLGTAWVI